MKRTCVMVGIVSLLIVFHSLSSAFAEDAVYYDGSSQMYRAFVLNTAELFLKETGIRVFGEEHTSGDAVPALISGKCNIGGVARKMNDQERAMGKDLEEVLICKDHMAVVAYGMELDNGLTMGQLQNIFSGVITDWKEVGGKPGPIRVVIPSSATACHKNFKKNVMGQLEFTPATVAVEKAGDVLGAVQTPGSITFISYMAVPEKPQYHILKIDGILPGFLDYTIAQDMYLVIRKDAPDFVKNYVIFFIKGKGRAYLNEMRLISPYLNSSM
ncbi:MAG TPA: substrate-binding domain-containing protein [Deltaproteobacteria bacterium]|nr:substrate-binding domain-containing protein [Deltaproteobacteria bacterium]